MKLNLKKVAIFGILTLGVVAALAIIFPSEESEKKTKCLTLKPGIYQADLDRFLGKASHNNPGWLSYHLGVLAAGPIMARIDPTGKVLELRCDTGDADSPITWKIE